MIENIAYILYTEGKSEWKEIHNDRFRIIIIKYNPKSSTSLLLGQRFSTVYCDAEFTKSASGREAIEYIKPCVNIGKHEFYLI